MTKGRDMRAHVVDGRRWPHRVRRASSSRSDTTCWREHVKANLMARWQLEQLCKRYQSCSPTINSQSKILPRSAAVGRHATAATPKPPFSSGTRARLPGRFGAAQGGGCLRPRSHQCWQLSPQLPSHEVGHGPNGRVFHLPILGFLHFCVHLTIVQLAHHQHGAWRKQHFVFSRELR